MKRLGMLVGITGCWPSGGPPDGSLTGTFDGASIDLELDADSKYWLERRTSCATLNQDIFALHYGGGQILIYFQLNGGSTILGERTFAYPQGAGSSLVWLSLDPSVPMLTTGTIIARVEGVLTTRRTGTLDLAFDDGSMLDAVYDMPYEVRGESMSCGDGFDIPDDDDP